MTHQQPILDPRIRVDGAVSMVETADGVVIHRIDQRFAHEVPVTTGVVERMPAGVRLVFRTSASEVAIQCTPTRLSFGGPARPATFDVVVDGVLVDSVDADFGHVLHVDPATGQSSLMAGEAGVVVLTGLTGADAVVEVWLPQSAGLELHAVTLPDGALFNPAPADNRPRWVHHGSSISHCMEADGPSMSWPAVAAAQTGHHVVNLGLAGHCQIDQFSARTIRDLDADVISLKLGINVVNANSMTERTFAPAIHGFLDTIREGHTDTPILVISPIICPAVEDLPGPTVLGDDGLFGTSGKHDNLASGHLSLSRIRELLADIVQIRQELGDANLHYLNGLTLFGPADVDDLPDGLHPNTAGYRLMGHRFAEHAFLTCSVR